jgi:ClpP class serine protease
MGVKTTEIVAGKYKRIASRYAPLSEEGMAVLQEAVDYLYSVFVNDVAKFRGVTEEDALRMADGKVFIGKQSIKAGLVDQISNFSDFVKDLGQKGIPQHTRAIIEERILKTCFERQEEVKGNGGNRDEGEFCKGVSGTL